jgi:A/G-specific adenine glycosylase
VLRFWSGLGYYQRARNLQRAARRIIESGGFPRDYDAIRDLPGVGAYTAAAVASIAFGIGRAVVDGNVMRVIARLTGDAADIGAAATKVRFEQTAAALLDAGDPGRFNQAMMELGATVCLPRQPQCTACPFRKFCRTRGAGPSTIAKPRQHKRETTYSLTRRAESIVFIRRSENESLMPGMWELPEVTSPRASDEYLFSVRHSITVTNFTVRVVARSRADGPWVRISRLNALPLTGLAKKILRVAKIIQ